MDIFGIFSMLGGLALFLFGMREMSNGLEKLAGGKLESILQDLTSNRMKSLVLGIIITAVIQSSSAATVMLVGLVNSGIMSLSSSVGIIMGSNIGTTVTAWLLSLAGLEGDNFFVQLLKPTSFSPLLAFLGIIFITTAKTSKKRDIGTTFVGFAILMYGMNMMGDAVKPLADLPEFAYIMSAFTNPLLGLVVGIVLTAIIQSSSASVGVLQAIAMTGGISYEMAIPIIMGQNIGTCVTALISSVGVNKNAKKVAVIHIAFNLIGTLAFMVIFFAVNYLVDMPIMVDAITPAGIAVLHSIFNIATTFMLLPFGKLLVKIADKVIVTTEEDEEEKHEIAFLDERLLHTPSIALAECNHITTDMSKLSHKTVIRAIDALHNFTPEKERKILKMERNVDTYEDRLGSYLVKLASFDLSDDDSMQISKLLHTISDFERISDHATNIMYVGKEIYEKKVSFSSEAKAEIAVLTAALDEIMEITFKAFDENDVDSAHKIEALEEVIDGIIEKIKARHIKRLKVGKCTIELGFILQDFLNNCERISDHCSNVGVALIELSKATFDTHEYLHKIKKESDEFKILMSEYEGKYHLEK